MTMHGFTVEKLIGQMGIKDLRRKKGRGKKKSNNCFKFSSEGVSVLRPDE